MNTEHLLGDFRLSVNIYSPIMLGCQEANNFFSEYPAVPAGQDPGTPAPEHLPYT